MQLTRTRIALLFAVIAIWSYSAIVLFPKNESVNSISKINRTSTEQKVMYTDTSTLLINYPDPFLKDLTINYMHPNNSKNIKRRIKGLNRQEPKVITSQKTIWPKVVYKGNIVNNSTEEMFAIMSISDRNFSLKNGDTAGSIVITSIWDDSIRLTNNSETKILKKE